MPAYDYTPMPLTQYSAFNGGLIPTDVFGVAINWYVNRNPLISRLPKLPVGSPHFLIVNDNYRPRSIALNNGAALSAGATSLIAADASVFDSGDVVQIEQEYLLVTAVDPATNVLTVTRGYAGTAAAVPA